MLRILLTIAATLPNNAAAPADQKCVVEGPTCRGVGDDRGLAVDLDENDNKHIQVNLLSGADVERTMACLGLEAHES